MDRYRWHLQFTALAFVAAVVVPRPGHADDIGRAYEGLAYFVIGALLVAVMMVVFIVLAVLLAVFRRRGRRGTVLVIATRALAVLWYLAALTPFATGLVLGGHEHGWNLLFGLVGGLPAHIPSLIALSQASRLARAT